jgi:uncharacterized protein (DUF433 family)
MRPKHFGDRAVIATPLPEPIPLHRDEHGRWRVGKTSVLLDVVIAAYRAGNTPETITEQYPVLSLEDVYLTLGCYLRHRAELEVYLRQQKAESEAARREDEANYPPTLTREILLARLAAKLHQSDE